MTQPLLREATPHDAAVVADLAFASSYHDALQAGVAPLLQDVQSARDMTAALLRVDPFGGLVAEIDGVPVATGWVHVRGRVATVGPVVVAPPWRGHDVGTLLLARLVERAGQRTAQVRMLDAGLGTTGLAVCLRAGFRIVAAVLSLALPPGCRAMVVEPDDGTMLRAATPEDRWHVVERDARSFGARREADVDAALEAGRLAVSERAGRLTGYALAHVLGRSLLVGAVAAEDPAVVLALVGHHVDTTRPGEGAVRITVPAGDQRVVDLALAAGFRIERLRAYLARGGGTMPPKGYLLMPFGGC